MLTSYFSLMSLEKARILVEIFIGDWVTSWFTNSNPQYGFLLWYYQFVRAETCWSLGFSFIILTCVVYAWWQSSYVHEGEHYELMGVSFPNDDKEWWYENLAELGTMVTYFLWFAFVDLPYYWKPHRPSLVILVTPKTAITKWLIGTRTYNPFAYLFSTKYNYRWTLWHVNFLDLTRWTLDEIRAVAKTRSVVKTQTKNGRGWFFQLGRPTTFWDRTKYYLRVGIRQGFKPDYLYRRLRIKKKKLPIYLTAPYLYRPISVQKKSKFVMYVNKILTHKRAFRIKRYSRRKCKQIKRALWRGGKIRQKLYFRKKKYIKRALRRFVKSLGVNMKRLNFSNRTRNRKRFNRGRFFIRYLRNIRTPKRLLPVHKQLQRHILKNGRRIKLVYSAREALNKKTCYLYSHRRFFKRRTIINPERPRWHIWYWRKYYYRRRDDDQRTRGALLANDISSNGKISPSMLIWAGINCYCYEEDEFDMYEEEFEDWDLEYDPEMGEVNFEDMEMEQDEDLLTLKRQPSEEFEALRFSESKQEIRDGDNITRIAEKLNDPEYDEDNEDDIVHEEYEDVDADLVMLGVDYLAAVFEFYRDPVPLTRERAQLHMTEGYAMPPAWGDLGDNSTNRRNLWDRVSAMLYSYYYHNHVDLDDGVSTADYWWDAEPKSWRHDGQPRDYLTLAGANWKTFTKWYLQEYRLKKKENDPEFYKTILVVDAETRKTRPHYHGMAFSRGYYYTPKQDQGVYYQNIIDSLPEEKRKLFYEYVDKVNERAARYEYIADDDYVTFEGGKYNPYSDNFGKSNQ